MTAGVQIEVVRASKGREVRSGDQLSVNYAGILVSDGSSFDRNYDFAEFAPIPERRPFSFLLGSGQVIDGWDQSLQGLRLGGIYDLTIPPDLAYGDRGTPTIPPGSTLQFRVELISAIPAGSDKPVYPLYSEIGLTVSQVGKIAAFRQAQSAGGNGFTQKIGSDQADALVGSQGVDVLLGLAGNDVLEGGIGSDLLIGGGGANRYVYTSAGDSSAGPASRDSIMSFSSRAGDRIDLTAISSDLNYIGKRRFTGDGLEVRFRPGSLQVELDGDGRMDMEIQLIGIKTLGAAALML